MINTCLSYSSAPDSSVALRVHKGMPFPPGHTKNSRLLTWILFQRILSPPCPTHTFPDSSRPFCWALPQPERTPTIQVQATPVRRTEIPWCTKGQSNHQKVNSDRHSHLDQGHTSCQISKLQRSENQRGNSNQGT